MRINIKKMVVIMKLITREELKQKLDRGEKFKLAMVLGDFAFHAKHIPGSLNVSTPEAVQELLSPEDEIVVYCSGPKCVASVEAFYRLKAKGYKNICRFAGGIEEWEEAGYPLEGDMVEEEK
jgi:rhodanese-related sulfurtransferase